MKDWLIGISTLVFLFIVVYIQLALNIDVLFILVALLGLFIFFTGISIIVKGQYYYRGIIIPSLSVFTYLNQSSRKGKVIRGKRAIFYGCLYIIFGIAVAVIGTLKVLWHL